MHPTEKAREDFKNDLRDFLGMIETIKGLKEIMARRIKPGLLREWGCWRYPRLTKNK